MQIEFYGVRGSIATPGKETVRYGGNTSCVYVEASDGTQFIFDAGTGIRKLGEKLIAQVPPKEINLLFSHYHWDHIQGFPFFLPVYKKGQVINLWAAHLKDVNAHSVLTQMTNPHFPVPSDKLEAQVNLLSTDSGIVEIGNNKVYSKSLNHPGGGSAYRLETPIGDMAYVTDNELDPPSKPTTTYVEWLNFLTNVDYLIHDAMYLDDELERIHGWGHSLISQVLQLASDTNVKNLILFHHDPSRTDDQLDAIAKKSQEWMARHNPECQVYVAKEGSKFLISSDPKTNKSRIDNRMHDYISILD